MGLSLKEMDIVYCVKDSPTNEELKYSLRSLKNIPHRDVYIYGGKPEWCNNVNHVYLEQNEGNKWANASVLLKAICENEKISEDFVWFNDDFFVMKKIQDLPYYYDRTLGARIMDFANKEKWWAAIRGRYPSRLRTADWSLKIKKLPSKNYELHIPIIFNKEKLLSVIQNFPGIGAKRSLYCNSFVQDGIQRQDVKIYDNFKIPNGEEDFLSTTDISFKEGEVGKYIRKKFRAKSPYEKGANGK